MKARKRASVAFCLAILLAVSWAGFEGAAADAPSDWASSEVASARSKGLVIAEADGNYQSPISRRLFCALVVNMVEAANGEPVSVTAENPFEDTGEAAVVKAYQMGIVKGISSTRFAPEEKITREQIAVMMMRGARKLDELKGTAYSAAAGAETLTFSDQAEISSWAISDVRAASLLGIMRGVGGGRIDPKGNTTVEQAILLICRLYDGFMAQLSGGTTSENSPPVALGNPVAFTAPEQTALTITAAQLASDPDGDALAITGIAGGCALGSAAVRPDGTCVYVSRDVASDSTDGFSAVVSDGGGSVVVSVRISIAARTAENNSPVAVSNPVVLSAAETTPLAISASQLALDPDGDALAVIRVNGQTSDYHTLYGTVSLTSDGGCVYTSNDVSANVSDDFPVTVSDGTNTANVNVRVLVSNSPEIVLTPTVSSVSVGGTAAVGEALAVTIVRYSGRVPSTPAELKYQWMRATSSDGLYIPIAGATGSAYTPTKNDVGKYLKVTVSASGSASGSAASAPAGPVAMFSGGEGTYWSPYRISNAQQLLLLDDLGMNTSGKYFELASDIALGRNQYVGSVFFGKLDGKMHAVTVDIELSGTVQAVGLFSKTSTTSEIKNLNVAGRISAPDSEYVGGIVGANSGGTIFGCLSAVEVTADNHAGAVAGFSSGVIERCGAIGAGATAKSMAGGLVGMNYYEGVVRDCYARAKAHADNTYSGGLVGFNNGLVERCYSAGKVECPSYAGGLVGRNDGGTVQSSYYDKDVSGMSDTGKGVPKTTSQMKTASTYSGWDFANIWTISPGSYPETRRG